MKDYPLEQTTAQIIELTESQIRILATTLNLAFFSSPEAHKLSVLLGGALLSERHRNILGTHTGRVFVLSRLKTDSSAPLGMLVANHRIALCSKRAPSSQYDGRLYYYDGFWYIHTPFALFHRLPRFDHIDEYTLLVYLPGPCWKKPLYQILPIFINNRVHIK
jgi:hypothetical protein